MTRAVRFEDLTDAEMAEWLGAQAPAAKKVRSKRAQAAQAEQRAALAELNARPPRWLLCGHDGCSWPAGCSKVAGVVVDVPERPFTTNEWGGSIRGQQMAMVKATRDMAHQLVNALRPCVRLAGPVTVTWTPWFPTRVPVDAGNLSRWAKAVLDGFVHAGLLYDDGPDIVVEETFRARHVGKGGSHVVVTIARA